MNPSSCWKERRFGNPEITHSTTWKPHRIGKSFRLMFLVFGANPVSIISDRHKPWEVPNRHHHHFPGTGVSLRWFGPKIKRWNRILRIYRAKKHQPLRDENNVYVLPRTGLRIGNPEPDIGFTTINLLQPKRIGSIQEVRFTISRKE